jgi:hypothetical protein
MSVDHCVRLLNRLQSVKTNRAGGSAQFRQHLNLLRDGLSELPLEDKGLKIQCLEHSAIMLDKFVGKSLDSWQPQASLIRQALTKACCEKRKRAREHVGDGTADACSSISAAGPGRTLSDDTKSWLLVENALNKIIELFPDQIQDTGNNKLFRCMQRELHPDKHGGSPVANTALQHLMGLRDGISEDGLDCVEVALKRALLPHRANIEQFALELRSNAEVVGVHSAATAHHYSEVVTHGQGAPLCNNGVPPHADQAPDTDAQGSGSSAVAESAAVAAAVAGASTESAVAATTPPHESTGAGSGAPQPAAASAASTAEATSVPTGSISISGSIVGPFGSIGDIAAAAAAAVAVVATTPLDESTEAGRLWLPCGSCGSCGSCCHRAPPPTSKFKHAAHTSASCHAPEVDSHVSGNSESKDEAHSHAWCRDIILALYIICCTEAFCVPT